MAFGARFGMTVDYPGYDGDPVPGLRLEGDCALDFDGILLVKDSLPEKPQTADAARALARPFLGDMALDVIDEGWRFVLRPAPADGGANVG